MDFSLTPEQELIRDSARAFCEREILPHAGDWDRAEELDRGLVPIEYLPLIPSAIVLHRDLRQMQQQRFPDALAAQLRLHEQVLLQPCAAGVAAC